MPNLNTKNLKYNILNRETDHSYWILSTIVSGIFMLFLAVILGTQEILQIKKYKKLNRTRYHSARKHFCFLAFSND